MAGQVSIAENIARVSAAGYELAQQLYRVGAWGEGVQGHAEELNSLRDQLRNLDTLLAATSDSSQDMIDELAFEDMKEGSYPATPSISELSFRQDSPSLFSPPMNFRRLSNEADDNSSARECLELEAGHQSCSSSLTEGEFPDIDLDDEIEDNLELNREDGSHLLMGDIQMFSPTQKIVESLRNPTEVPPTFQNLEPESSPRIQIIHAGATHPKNRLSHSHSRKVSGCSDSSTLQGSVHEDEEFPMRKDWNEDVIHVIEIPLKSSGRKRGSSLFGTIKRVVSKN